MKDDGGSYPRGGSGRSGQGIIWWKDLADVLDMESERKRNRGCSLYLIYESCVFYLLPVLYLLVCMESFFSDKLEAVNHNFALLHTQKLQID